MKESIGNAQLSVVRQNGADGDVDVKWRTIDKTAVSGKDYEGGEGVITFKHGETKLHINIPIIDDMEYEKDENFEVELYEVTNNAKLGKTIRYELDRKIIELQFPKPINGQFPQPLV